MGTALTEDQMRLLKRFTRRIVLALDPDTAGQKAVLRGLDAARSAMDKEAELGFDARGLLRNESRLQADLRVATMPDDLDPDEIVSRNKEEWKRLIEAAKPIVTHVMETLAAGQNLNDPKVKNQVAAQVLPLIEDLPNALERDTYRQALARMLRVDERALIGAPAPGPRVRRSRRDRISHDQAVERPPDVLAFTSSRRVEEYLIGALFQRPDLLYKLDRRLEEGRLAPLAPEDFDRTDHQIMFGLIRDAVTQDKTDHHDFVMESIPESLRDLAADLLQRSGSIHLSEDKLVDELLRGIKRMREEATSQMLVQHQFLQREAQEGGDQNSVTFYQREVLKLTQLKRALDEFGSFLTASR
jgi:DNA primase